MVTALPFVFLLALISCHVIEKPAMSLRRPVADFLRRRVRSAVSSSRPFGGAAVGGAKVSFVIGSTLVLISEKRWWYFLESMSVVFLSVVAGLFITIATCRVLMIGGLVSDSVDRGAA
jgi:peptidoglycan/LPS O-acetylase OafA/YrhL